MHKLGQATADRELAHPWVSVIVPARDEESSLGRCLDGLVAQDYPHYEVIVVDDGSTDATPAILAGYARRYATLVQPVSGRLPPRGWVGKCNACLHGSQFARGEWLLFLDADTAPQPGLISALIDDAVKRRLDALSVFPFNELGSFAERIVLPVFFQFAWTVFPLARAAQPDVAAEHALANGQCFMFRATTYCALGGHAAVKDNVLEDVEFAHVLRRAGYRLGLAFGMQYLSVRMYHNFAEVEQGLAKHAWSGRQAGGWRSYWGIAHLMLTTLVPPLVLGLGLLQVVSQRTAPDLLAHATASTLALAVAAAGYAGSLLFWRDVLRRLYRARGALAWLMPFGLLAYLFIILRGTLAVLLNRGVTWKGRTYASRNDGRTGDGRV